MIFRSHPTMPNTNNSGDVVGAGISAKRTVNVIALILATEHEQKHNFCDMILLHSFLKFCYRSVALTLSANRAYSVPKASGL